MESIFNYSDSSSSNEEFKYKLESTKTLEIPEEVLGLYNADNVEDVGYEDPEKYDGRIRSFKHERGNWATHIFAPVNPSSEDQDLIRNIQDNAISILGPQWKPILTDKLHISLSKTVILAHHQIDPLQNSIQMSLTSYRKFQCDFGLLEVYTNERHTRTFVGITMLSKPELLVGLISIIDNVLESFNLEKYYEEPSIHISIASAVGDVSMLALDTVNQLSSTTTFPKPITLDIDHVILKSGCKIFQVYLH